MDDDGLHIQVIETGKEIILDDVGRCFRLFHLDGTGYAQDIAKSEGWARTVRRIRKWVREGGVPIGDIHAPALR
jgi:hypothetical protein